MMAWPRRGRPLRVARAVVVRALGALLLQNVLHEHHSRRCLGALDKPSREGHDADDIRDQRARAAAESVLGVAAGGSIQQRGLAACSCAHDDGNWLFLVVHI